MTELTGDVSLFYGELDGELAVGVLYRVWWAEEATAGDFTAVLTSINNAPGFPDYIDSLSFDNGVVATGIFLRRVFN